MSKIIGAKGTYIPFNKIDCIDMFENTQRGEHEGGIRIYASTEFCLEIKLPELVKIEDLEERTAVLNLLINWIMGSALDLVTDEDIQIQIGEITAYRKSLDEGPDAA